MSIRRAASWPQPRQVSSAPRGARTGRAPGSAPARRRAARSPQALHDELPEALVPERRDRDQEVARRRGGRGRSGCRRRSGRCTCGARRCRSRRCSGRPRRPASTHPHRTSRASSRSTRPSRPRCAGGRRHVGEIAGLRVDGERGGERRCLAGQRWIGQVVGLAVAVPDERHALDRRRQHVEERPVHEDRRRPARGWVDAVSDGEDAAVDVAAGESDALAASEPPGRVVGAGPGPPVRARNVPTAMPTAMRSATRTVGLELPGAPRNVPGHEPATRSGSASGRTNADS